MGTGALGFGGPEALGLCGPRAMWPRCPGALWHWGTEAWGREALAALKIFSTLVELFGLETSESLASLTYYCLLVGRFSV